MHFQCLKWITVSNHVLNPHTSHLTQLIPLLKIAFPESPFQIPIEESFSECKRNKKELTVFFEKNVSATAALFTKKKDLQMIKLYVKLQENPNFYIYMIIPLIGRSI